MLCENCGNKDATSIFMPTGSNKIKYLCGECYKKLNNDADLDRFAFSQSQNVAIDVVCSNCGTTYKEFEKSGLFGCAECYNAFSEYINKKILPMFKETKYLGRKPNMFYVESEIKNLEQLIEICLKNGNLQKATKYGKELERLKEENYDRL